MSEQNTVSDNELSVLMIDVLKKWKSEGKNINLVYNDHETRCKFIDELKGIKSDIQFHIVYPMIGELWWKLDC